MRLPELTPVIVIGHHPFEMGAVFSGNIVGGPGVFDGAATEGNSFALHLFGVN